MTGKKIGPLEEIKDNLDTGADAFYAKWSSDSKEVAIRYRIDRREALLKIGKEVLIHGLVFPVPVTVA